VCDGVDNDCNGQIDDKVVELGDPCQDSSKKGECQNGTYTACTNKQLTCTSNTQPTTEICDDGKDNDCDGTIDSGTKCPCKDGETRPCGNDTGSCTKGTETCQSGQWGTCVGGTQPTAEICDGIDNDCDGQTDEDFTTLGNSCTAGQGICQATGRIVCSTDKQSTICNATAGTNSTAEICDGKDNDCNGQVDDVATVGDTCTAGQGECQNTGKKVCNFNTNKVECNAKAGTPKTEVCDGKDNDCDGIIDNAPGTRNTGSLKQTCYTGPQNTKGIGPCRAGTQSCINGKWGACFGEVTPSAVDGCSNEDANCNGTPNEGCSCTNGTTRPCGTNTGTCVAGNQTCNNGQWGPCTGNTAPTTEVCDGKDNNCNGQTDEGTSGGTCTNGTGACQRNGTLICKGAKLECNAVPGNPSPEICDGKDNNCDGQVDNLSSTASQFCNTGLLGLCAKGTPSCVNGQITCTPAFQPGQLTEICRNNQDDDCDGKVDEICGPLYPYALVNRGGGFFNQKKRAFSSAARTGTGTYTLTPTSSKCTTTPIFLTPYGLYPQNMSYTCSGNNYIVYSGQEQKGSTPNGTKADADFYAVVPTTSDTYAVVNSGCGYNKTCSTSTKRGTISVKRIDTGTYEITSPLCNESYRPVFATIRGDQPKAFIATNRYSGKCYVYTRDQNGSRTNNYGFAVWLPNTQTAAFAVITPGNTPTIHTKNDFGDQKARWTVRDFVYSSQSCPDTNNACRRTAVYFPSWANPSAIILNVRDNYVGGASVVLRNVTNPLENILVSVTGNTRGRVSNVRFNILFVQ
jgi:hypothetical protein